MNILGIELNSTQGHWETAPIGSRDVSRSESRGGTLEESSTAVNEGKPDLISCLDEPGITSVNTGKQTAGIDKEVINTPAQRVKLVNEWGMPKAKPTKRVYIPKSNGKKRPLGI